MKSDIYRILDFYRIYYEQSKNSSELLVLFPFHNDTNLGSALFNIDTEKFHCFSCNIGSGDKYAFVAKLEGCSYKEAINFVENGFQYEKLYDLERLKLKLKRSRNVNNSFLKEFNILEKKFEEKVFFELNRPNITIQTKAKWIVILSYYTHITKITKEIYNSIFELYTLFLSDIKQEMKWQK